MQCTLFQMKLTMR